MSTSDPRPSPPDASCTCGARAKAARGIISAHGRLCPQRTEEDSDWCAQQFAGQPQQIRLAPPDLREQLLTYLAGHVNALYPPGHERAAESIEQAAVLANIVAILDPPRLAPLLDTTEPLRVPEDPSVRALAEQMGRLVEHIKQSCHRSDRRQLGHLRRELARLEAAGEAQTEHEQATRAAMREEIVELERALNPAFLHDEDGVHRLSEREVAQQERVDRLAARQRNATAALVQGVTAKMASGRMDTPAVVAGAWKALRLLSPAEAEAAEAALDGDSERVRQIVSTLTTETGARGEYQPIHHEGKAAL